MAALQSFSGWSCPFIGLHWPLTGTPPVSGRKRPQQVERRWRQGGDAAAWTNPGTRSEQRSPDGSAAMWRAASLPP